MKRFLPTHKEYLCTNEVLYTDHVTLISVGEQLQVSQSSLPNGSCLAKLSTEYFSPTKDEHFYPHVINTQMTFDCAKKEFYFLCLFSQHLFPLLLLTENRHNFDFKYLFAIEKEQRNIFVINEAFSTRSYEKRSEGTKGSISPTSFVYKCKMKFPLTIVCCR